MIDHLIHDQNSGDVLLNEVPFANYKRRADLVHVNGLLHAYEIKSSFDNLIRLVDQIPDYEKTFDKVTLVTTREHLPNVRKILPKKIGIALVDKNKIQLIRQAKEIKRLDKYYLSCFLPKRDLITEIENAGFEKLIKISSKTNSYEIRELISNTLNTQDIRHIVLQYLKKRHRDNFETFLNYRGHVTAPEDIRMLSANYSLSLCALLVS